MNPAEQLGAYLRHHRKTLGLTQERVAELCDLTPEHISGIERGRRFPSMKTLIRLADTLHITLSEAFRFQKPRPGPKPKPSSKPVTERDRAFITLNRRLAKRSPKEIRFLAEIVKRFREP